MQCFQFRLFSRNGSGPCKKRDWRSSWHLQPFLSLSFTVLSSQVNLIISHLQSDRRLSKASHPTIYAFVFKGEGGVIHRDNDDDGESAAGGRLSHLLDILVSFDCFSKGSSLPLSLSKKLFPKSGSCLSLHWCSLSSLLSLQLPFTPITPLFFSYRT